jgi:hypothetical protein
VALKRRLGGSQTPVYSNGSSNYELGYIQLGVPYSIPQLVIPLENLEKKTEGKNQLLMNLPYVSPNGVKRVDSISQKDVESELLHPMFQCIDAIEKGESRAQYNGPLVKTTF